MSTNFSQNVTLVSGSIASSRLETSGSPVIITSTAPVAGTSLIATNTTVATWQFTDKKAEYLLSSATSSITATTATNLVYFVWDNTAFTNYSNGTIKFYTTIVDRNVSTRFYDGISGNIYGSYTAEASGVHSFTVTNPTSNTFVALQTNKGAVDGTSPSLFGIHLHYNK